MTAIIVMLLMVAFVVARIMRSTKVWWTLVFSIMAGLLVGILGKATISSDNKEDSVAITQVVNTINNEYSADMQSLESTVTESTSICQSGVAGNLQNTQKLLDALTTITYEGSRDSPAIKNSS